MSVRETVFVSEEMVALLGVGEIDASAWPDNPVGFIFSTLGADRVSTVTYVETPTAEGLANDAGLCLIVARSACERIFGGVPESEGEFLLPPSLRAIASSLQNCPMPEPARSTLRLAKAIELLCETLPPLRSNALPAAAGQSQMSYRDCERIQAARRLIEQRWQEKLTLNSIASACGLNRSKLARGFRDMFNSSVATVIAEQRLGEARQLLLSTELPISSIGYQCGYQNNAAFTRAFSRRHGMAPSNYRVSALAS